MVSLPKIFQALIASGNKEVKADNSALEGVAKEITSIRLNPKTRKYLQIQSAELGISLSQFINIILDGVVEIEVNPMKNHINSLYDRLILLFDEHKISTFEMSLMLNKFGVTLSMIKHQDAMLDLLTPNMLREVSDWFGVSLPWLIEGKGSIYERETIGWYKNSKGMIASIIERIVRYGRVEVFVLKNNDVTLSDAEKYDDGENHLQMGFLIKYRKTIEGVSFYVYERCEFQRWNYINCRDYLKQVFLGLEALEHRFKPVGFTGYSLDNNELVQLRFGKALPVTIDKILHNSAAWYPEDTLNGRKAPKEIERYIEAYSDSPSKVFTIFQGENNDGYTINVRVLQSDIKVHEYFSMGFALDDLYSKYHEVNQ